MDTVRREEDRSCETNWQIGYCCVFRKARFCHKSWVTRSLLRCTAGRLSSTISAERLLRLMGESVLLSPTPGLLFRLALSAVSIFGKEINREQEAINSTAAVSPIEYNNSIQYKQQQLCSRCKHTLHTKKAAIRFLCVVFDTKPARIHGNRTKRCTRNHRRPSLFYSCPRNKCVRDEIFLSSHLTLFLLSYHNNKGSSRTHSDIHRPASLAESRGS